MSTSLTQNPSSGISLSIRGTAVGAPSSRIAANALRGAGISREATLAMELDGASGGRPTRSNERRIGRSGGSSEKTSRHRPSTNTPYGRTAGGKERNNSLPNRPGGASSSSTQTNRRANTNLNPRRQPEGTPDLVRRLNKEQHELNRTQHAKLTDKLNGEGMKNWVKSREISPGVMNLSGMNDDPWLKEQGIIPPGHPEAPPMAGHVFWRLVDHLIQQTNKTPVHTLSLANNGFKSLSQLSRLPLCLPNLRHLDLSDNPIRRIQELDELLAAGEKKGKATAGIGSLKSLIELKLNGCQFREELLAKPDGADKYQHDILRRFPGLRILDGVSLNRIVFPIERKPKIRRTEDERKALQATAFTYPVDVQGGFIENDSVQKSAMEFCAKFFPLFDNNRQQIILGYAPNATISVSANTLPSRSIQANEITKTRSTRPNPIAFTPWTELPGRNLLRFAETVEQRMFTMKSPMNEPELLRWWNAIPSTKHPLEDAEKWCIDAWVLDGEGVNTKLCVMIQGQFEEMPSGTYRSFSRTFILGVSPEGSPAFKASWPAIILSDTMIIHAYLGTASYDNHRTLAVNGISISPPTPSSQSPELLRDAYINSVRQRTGMNVTFATMCLEQNGWDLEGAIRNFGEIKDTIPAEAFQ